jgi:hypothetical protein
MTTTTHAPSTTSTRSPALLRTAGIFLILAGITFFLYGPLHPGDSGEGSKVDALIEMLENPRWMPAHLFGLTSYACFAAAVAAIRKGIALVPMMRRVTSVVFAIGAAGTVAMLPHALAFAGADAIRAGGEDAFWYQLMTWNESIVNAVWALSMAALIAAGGLTRTIGSRLIALLGLVGALAYALALATVPFIDTFDALFPVSGLLAVWAVIAGSMLLVRRGWQIDIHRPSFTDGSTL